MTRHTPSSFVATELARFDGATETTPIYVAINGKVFDVSSKRETYAKTAGYGIFAGQDASWALATMEMDPKKWNMDGHLPDLSDSARDSLYQWVRGVEWEGARERGRFRGGEGREEEECTLVVDVDADELVHRRRTSRSGTRRWGT